MISSAVQQMEADSQLVTVGVDTVRYVLPAYSDCWLVPFGKCLYVPAPWFTPSGEIYAPAVRYTFLNLFQGFLKKILQKKSQKQNIDSFMVSESFFQLGL